MLGEHGFRNGILSGLCLGDVFRPSSDAISLMPPEVADRADWEQVGLDLLDVLEGDDESPPVHVQVKAEETLGEGRFS